MSRRWLYAYHFRNTFFHPIFILNSCRIEKEYYQQINGVEWNQIQYHATWSSSVKGNPQYRERINEFCQPSPCTSHSNWQVSILSCLTLDLFLFSKHTIARFVCSLSGEDRTVSVVTMAGRVNIFYRPLAVLPERLSGNSCNTAANLRIVAAVVGKLFLEHPVTTINSRLPDDFLWFGSRSPPQYVAS